MKHNAACFIFTRLYLYVHVCDVNFLFEMILALFLEYYDLSMSLDLQILGSSGSQGNCHLRKLMLNCVSSSVAGSGILIRFLLQWHLLNSSSTWLIAGCIDSLQAAACFLLFWNFYKNFFVIPNILIWVSISGTSANYRHAASAKMSTEFSTI